jgi:hypothetical protein
MILAYIDEAGTNYKKNKSGNFIDGPYALWIAIFVSEEKYFHLERAFQKLAKKFLNKNIRISELHGTNIWSKIKSNPQSEQNIRMYFEELFQLISSITPYK